MTDRPDSDMIRFLKMVRDGAGHRPFMITSKRVYDNRPPALIFALSIFRRKYPDGKLLVVSGLTGGKMNTLLRKARDRGYLEQIDTIYGFGSARAVWRLTERGAEIVEYGEEEK